LMLYPVVLAGREHRGETVHPVTEYELPEEEHVEATAVP